MRDAGSDEMDGAWQIDAAEISRRIEALMTQATRLGENGWTLPMWATPFEVHQLMQRATEDQDLDALFLEYYDAYDGAAYGWLKRELAAKPKLKRWHAMIEQCLVAFERRLYLVVVPSMLTVLEGCIAEAGGPRVLADLKKRGKMDRTSLTLSAGGVSMHPSA
jgi:hypothetical protein